MKSEDKSNNSASRRRRHWKSVKGLNRTSFQACDSICNKSKLGWDMKVFYFHCNFQPHQSNLPKMRKIFTKMWHTK